MFKNNFTFLNFGKILKIFFFFGFEKTKNNIKFLILISLGVSIIKKFLFINFF